MTSRKHIIQVLFLGAPLLAGLISEFFMYLADSAMVGRLGTTHLAAIGIAVLFGEILWVIVWPLAPATQTIAARRFGRMEAMTDKSTEAYSLHSASTGAVLNHGVLVGILAGIVLRVRSFLFLGVSFLTLALFTVIWHAAVDLHQTWLWYVSGIVMGILIIAVFALFEKKRTEMLEIVERLKNWEG